MMYKTDRDRDPGPPIPDPWVLDPRSRACPPPLTLQDIKDAKERDVREWLHLPDSSSAQTVLEQAMLNVGLR